MGRPHYAVVLVSLVGSACSGGETREDTPPAPVSEVAAEPQVDCESYMKECDGGCVPRNRARTGCDSESCEPCPSAPHREAVCDDDGACALAKCDEGYGDCDDDASNGCETPVSDNPDHCGRCDLVCEAVDHAEGTCEAGDCTLTCEEGFFDNDGAYHTGCEGESFAPLEPIAHLASHDPACPFPVPSAGDECPAPVPWGQRCEYTNPRLACHCSVLCDEPHFLGQRGVWAVDCHYCGTPETSEWSLGFSSATLGDLGTIAGPTASLTVNYNRCEKFVIDTDAMLADCGNAYIPGVVRQQSDGSEVAVFYFADLRLEESSEIELKGSRPLALVGKNISVSKSWRLRRWLKVPGPLPGAGQDAPTLEGHSSGGGGGHCTAGGKSGSGAAGGSAFADETAPLLAFGAPGGRSDFELVDGGPNGVPDYSRAGGAIQLIAAESITIAESAGLYVDGWQGTSTAGYGSGGGNSGGTIILEAPQIIVDGYLSALGGEGGDTFVGPAGSDGTLPGGAGSEPAQGGGAGAGVILLYGDDIKIFEPRIAPAQTTPCTELRPLLR